MPTYLQFKNGTPHYVRDNAEVNEPLQYQPYRTTPLILPGAKVKKDVMPTESYLRHHPNPAVRAAPSHDYHDVLMKQKVADSVLHRVVGEDAASGKVAHRQFNSPIGLYSDSNIENTIRQTVPIFIDLSFLELKQKILEQQKEKQLREQLERQHRRYF
ncbi:uncharacterized protein LOC119647941 isoform X10 [Hermetia illucens]|uniref:uncharacterized protein LOC119647941 isoform X10 n=1 Tax=Hermetia illucens TaxID=343691 RepID=UPI0018CC1872|nr:uncharacterized protein LOC119647941 isoform X10 [Hermetia illucens]